MSRDATGRPARLTLRPLALALAMGLVLAACASDWLYASGRNAQRTECLKMLDAAARERCLKDAAMPERTYQRESEAARRSTP
jgi:hypothetical protein